MAESTTKLPEGYMTIEEVATYIGKSPFYTRALTRKHDELKRAGATNFAGTLKSEWINDVATGKPHKAVSVASADEYKATAVTRGGGRGAEGQTWMKVRLSKEEVAGLANLLGREVEVRSGNNYNPEYSKKRRLALAAKAKAEKEAQVPG